MLLSAAVRGIAMDDVGAFVSTVVPKLREEVRALHNGDVAPRMALWSHNEPVTLFGAELSLSGWGEIEPAFRWLASTFSGSQSCEYEVLAAGASGDLGYVVALERSVMASYVRNPRHTTCASPRYSDARTARGRSSTGTPIRTPSPPGTAWQGGPRQRALQRARRHWIAFRPALDPGVPPAWPTNRRTTINEKRPITGCTAGNCLAQRCGSTSREPRGGTAIRTAKPADERRGRVAPADLRRRSATVTKTDRLRARSLQSGGRLWSRRQLP
jgi:hypothetical protein